MSWIRFLSCHLFSPEQKKKIHDINSLLFEYEMVECLTLLKFCGNLHFITVAACMCAFRVVAFHNNYFICQLSKTLRINYCYILACNASLLVYFSITLLYGFTTVIRIALTRVGLNL